MFRPTLPLGRRLVGLEEPPALQGMHLDQLLELELAHHRTEVVLQLAADDMGLPMRVRTAPLQLTAEVVLGSGRGDADAPAREDAELHLHSRSA